MRHRGAFPSSAASLDAADPRHHARGERRKLRCTDTPLARPGQPAELAPVYVLLASDEGSYISGARIGVTGALGTTCRATTAYPYPGCGAQRRRRSSEATDNVCRPDRSRSLGAPPIGSPTRTYAGGSGVGSVGVGAGSGTGVGVGFGVGSGAGGKVMRFLSVGVFW